MANFASLKATIDAQIKANGNQEITGPILNAVLTAMINTIGNGYALQGTVAQTSDNPGSPDNPVAYLAAGPGTYTDFGGTVIPDDGHAYLLTWDTSWTAVQLPLATFDLVNAKADKSTTYTKTETDNLLDGKQDKDTAAAPGDVALFDSLGNTVSSGTSFSLLALKDLLAIAGDVAVMDANGNAVDGGTPLADLALQTAVDNKADKVGGAANGDLPELDADGNLSLSGLAVSDLMVKEPAATEDNLASFDNAGQVKDSGIPSGNVAQQDGNYPSLISGAAQNLVGHGSVGAEYTRRTSGGSADIGSGAAQITKLKGKTIAWNQAVARPSNSSENGITFTWNDDGSVTISGVASAQAESDSINISQHNGHKYFVSIRNSAAGVSFLGRSISGFPGIAGGDASRVDVATAEGAQSVALIVDVGTDLSTPLTVWPQIVDLTLMGIASVISTPADFETLYPGAHPYNAGKLKNNDALAVVTTGFNQWDEVWEVGDMSPTTGNPFAGNYVRSKNFCKCFGGTNYFNSSPNNLALYFYDAESNFITANQAVYAGVQFTTPANAALFKLRAPSIYGTTYKNDICINLSDAAINGQYFPYWKRTLRLGLNALACHDENDNPVTVNGLDGVGSVYDEGVVENGMLTKIVKRFGKYVFTGDETWENYGLGTAKVTTISSLGAKTLSGTDMPNAIGSFRLLAQTRDDIYSGAKDGFSIDENNIQVSDYTKCTAGTAVVFELATPVVLTLDNPIPVSYRVDDFGTEERTSPVDAYGAQSAPIVYDVQYAMNAVDTLRRLPENYISKDSATNLLEALKTAGIISAYTMTYNSTTQEYEFTVTP